METEKRLIDANALVDSLKSTNIRLALDKGKMFKLIDDAPTVDAVEVVHGRWKPADDPVLYNIYGVTECSVCGYEYSGNSTNYCPNCGAHMCN